MAGKLYPMVREGWWANYCYYNPSDLLAGLLRVRRRIATKRRMAGACGPSMYHTWAPFGPPSSYPGLNPMCVVYSTFARYYHFSVTLRGKLLIGKERINKTQPSCLKTTSLFFIWTSLYLTFSCHVGHFCLPNWNCLYTVSYCIKLNWIAYFPPRTFSKYIFKSGFDALKLFYVRHSEYTWESSKIGSGFWFSREVAEKVKTTNFAVILSHKN